MQARQVFLLLFVSFMWYPVHVQAQAAGAGFWYRPLAGTRIQMIWRSEYGLTYVGFRALPDSSTATVTSLVSITRRVIESGGGRSTVRVQVDSVRSRLAEEGRAARVLDFKEVAGSSAEVVLDSALAVVQAGPPAGVRSVRIGRAVAGDLSIDFSEVAVTGEDSLTVNAEIPFTSRISGDTANVFDAVLRGRVVLHVDSTRVRGTDTLAYLYVAGPLTGVTRSSVPEVGGGSQSLTGSLKARLIWSSAWQGFVSAAVAARFVLEQKVSSDPSEASRILLADLVATGRVRP